jgi:preprotein translocase subunit SecA
MSMTKTERTELRRIIKNRYEHLYEQIAVREGMIAAQFREQLVEKSQAKIDEHTKEIKSLLDDYNKIVDRLNEALRAASDDGLTTPYGSRYDHADLTRVKFQLAGIEREVTRAVQRVREEAGLSKLDLRSDAIALDEELAIGSLQSDDARDFLARIPTIDTLLPLPSGDVPQIEA